MAKRQSEIRFTVIRDYYSDDGLNMTSPHCVLFGTEAEAQKMMEQLNGGCDPSYFNPSDEESGFLYVDQVTL